MCNKHTKGPTLLLSISVVFLLFISMSTSAFAQVEVDINFDVKHSVGGEDSFDREKYIVIHADATESDYSRNADRLNELLVTYDAHYGRETGRMRFIGDNVFEDPDRLGFAEPDRILELGQALNGSYLNDTVKHPTEFKGRTIVAAQERPFFPNGQMTSPVPFGDIPAVPSFSFSITDDPNDDADFGTATGEFMGLFLRDAYGDGSLGTGPDGTVIDGTPGAPRPTWVEVINEPFFPLIDFAAPGEQATIDEIFELHRSVAREVKAINPELKVGGFTNAFPDLEWRSPTSNKLFSQWDERWRRFIDEAGEDMDFYSIHLYDFHSIGGGNLSNAGTPGSGVTDSSREILRKGGNIEATLDMIEHYNTIRYGEVKPWLISEYGAQLNDFYGEFWSPQRDWFILKSFSSMMMQFMERPNVIEKTVPFVLARADFLFGAVVPDRVYPWRMLRDENEPTSIDLGQIENSVFTEVIKFYQLWSDVNGTRVDTLSTDPDLMVDAYVDSVKNKAYVILNSLDKADLNVNLNEFGIEGVNVTSVNIKHLFQADDGAPKLTDDDFASAPASVVVKPEGTMVVEYTFDAVQAVDETAIEEKIYATTYNQEIRADQTITFTVPGVSIGDDGEAMLRLGLGRSAFLSRSPIVLVNNNAIVVPEDYRGDTQLGRDVFPLGENVFFSMLEIPVPYDLLVDGDNEVKVTFPDGVSDNSGAVSSLALQTFRFSREVTRTVPADPSLPDRARAISWDNLSAFVADGGTLPRFELGDEENITVSYATGVANGAEEDLTYVATQIRQLDENGAIVGTSAFNLAVPGAVDNVGSTTFSYTIPSNFATGPDNVSSFTDPIPESSDLPPNHSLVLVLFMATDNNTLFANANTEIMIGDGVPPVESRNRSITFNNITDFIPAGASVPELGIGQTLNVNITYATGITDFVEEDLFYVATFVRQEDENGVRVADSAFTTVVGDAADDASTTTFAYTIPTNFAVDNTGAAFTGAIPETADLPAGHQLRLILFMSTNNNALFADANTDITIGEPTDNSNPADNRARSINFDNIIDFIPAGSILPQADIGESLDITVTYATGVAAGVEEDFAYIATQVRQLDENMETVATSAFNTAVAGTEPNSGTTTFTYVIPSNFETGLDNSTAFTGEIPDTVDLPEGHSLQLILFMSTNDNTFFIDANTEIIIGEVPPVTDRDRSLSFDNIADFIPAGRSLPSLDIGDELNIKLTYETGAVAGVEEDLTFIATQVRQLDENGGIVGTSEFTTLVAGSEANAGVTQVSYTVPSNFATGPDPATPFTGEIPDTVDLPDGHTLLLILFMATDGSNFIDANTGITIGELPVVANRTRALSFDNIGNFIPAGQSVPNVDIGDELDIVLSYATGVNAGVEEDLTFIAAQVRQLDENNGIVGTSEFITVVDGAEANTGTAQISYTVPTNFATGVNNSTPFTDPIPNTVDLPDGHTLLLILFMGTDGSNFIDANTEIIIGELPPVADRDRSITFANIADFIPAGQIIPNVDIGDVLNIDVNYATGASAGVEEDLTFIATQVRQLDENGATVATSAFTTVVDGASANVGLTQVAYTIPTNFVTGVDNATPFTGEIPDTVDLPDGHTLLLILFMSTDNINFLDANTAITIGELPLVADRVRSLNFDNIDDFIPAGQTLPNVDIGDVLNIDLSYATGASAGVEEDLTFIATQVRQLDENGTTVATSEFTTVVDGASANVGSTQVAYTIPTNFATGADNVTPFTGEIPDTADLPDGHTLILVLFMSTDDRNLVDANTEIVIGELPSLPPSEDDNEEVCFPIQAKNGGIAVICL